MSHFPYPQCRTCLNRELDPDMCDSCDYGSNYEPEFDDDVEDFEDDYLSIIEFRELLEAA